MDPLAVMEQMVAYRFKQAGNVKVKIHLRRTEIAQAKYGKGLVVGKFVSPIKLYRVMDGEELKNIADTGEIKGGDYSVPGERTFGAQWGADRAEVVKWGDGQRGKRLGHELFLAEIDGQGLSFAHLNMGEGVLKGLPKAAPHEPGTPEDNWHDADIPASECSTGLGCSLHIRFRDVKAWYVVEEGGKVVKTPWAQLQEQTPELGLKPRRVRLWYAGLVVPQPKIKAFLRDRLFNNKLRRIQDEAEQERVRREHYQKVRSGRPPSNWQKLLLKKTCDLDNGCPTWVMSHTLAEKDAKVHASDGVKQFAVMFQARAMVAVPFHQANIFEYDLTQIQLYDPDVGRWDQVWNGSVPITRKDIPSNSMYGSMLNRTPTHKVAAKYVARKTLTKADYIKALGEALAIHRNLWTWVHKFPRVLHRAERESTGIPDGWVWQNELLRYWAEFEPLRRQLEDVDKVFDQISLTHLELEESAQAARTTAYDPPRKAQLDYAFSQLDFFPHPKDGRDHIAYSVARLEEWADAFGSWVVRSKRILSHEKTAAARL